MSIIKSIVLATLLCTVAVLGHAQEPVALRERLLVASPATIASEPELLALVTTLAQSAITEHCAACHGATLEGATGVPSLVDYEWIWGIAGDEISAVDPVHKIMQTVLYGIRDRDCPEDTKSYSACPDTRYSEMPAYRMLGLTDAQLNDLTDYVLSLSGQDHDAAAIARAAAYTGLCVECHGDGGVGYRAYGGPDLSDDIWLYGGSRDDIFASIADGRMGYCPPYWDTLDAPTIKALGVYLYRRYMGY
jgi:cytochrome c oxidase cbb3-type subunit 3